MNLQARHLHSATRCACWSSVFIAGHRGPGAAGGEQSTGGLLLYTLVIYHFISVLAFGCGCTHTNTCFAPMRGFGQHEVGTGHGNLLARLLGHQLCTLAASLQKADSVNPALGTQVWRHLGREGQVHDDVATAKGHWHLRHPQVHWALVARQGRGRAPRLSTGLGPDSGQLTGLC